MYTNAKRKDKETNQSLKYDLPLPQDVESMLQEDFFMIDHVSGELLANVNEPMKFSANTWIFVHNGSCAAEISLMEHHISGPTFVTIDRSRIMKPSSFSKDFDAAFMVFSDDFFEKLSMPIANTGLIPLMSRNVAVKIPDEIQGDVAGSLKRIRRILDDKENPYTIQALLGELTALFFSSLYKCYIPFQNQKTGRAGRMTSQFLSLVQEHYRKERYLDFYAEKIGVSNKYLSKVVKDQTGYTALEWMERFVILEAKVLLRSSNLNIQQIAQEFNFPSQSLFGKYFKKCTGISPREFRKNLSQEEEKIQ